MGSYSRSGTADPRTADKRDMVELSDELARYVQNVRRCGGDSNSAAFLSAVKSMEQEVERMKALYEKELDNYRKQLDEANRQKNATESEIDKYQRLAKDFDDRKNIECDKNSKLMNELNAFQQRIAALEKELAGAKSEAQGPQAKLGATQQELGREQTRNRDLERELDQEKTRSKEMQDKVRDQQQQAAFKDQVSSEERNDAASHLEQAKRLISDLEKKNAALKGECADIPKLLEEIRKKMDKDLQAYKDEMEGSSRKSTDVIKHELDDQCRMNEQLKADITKLNKENESLMARIRYLEGQTAELRQQKDAAEEKLRLERSRAENQIKLLEKKLKELTDQLLEKIQEASTGKDTQISLRAEIEKMQALLKIEGDRLKAGQTGDQSRGSTGYATERQSLSQQSGNESTLGDRNNMTSSMSKAPGKWGKYRVETEYQYSYNRDDGKAYHYGDSGLMGSSGLPTIASGGCVRTGSKQYSARSTSNLPRVH